MSRLLLPPYDMSVWWGVCFLISSPFNLSSNLQVLLFKCVCVLCLLSFRLFICDHLFLSPDLSVWFLFLATHGFAEESSTHCYSTTYESMYVTTCTFGNFLCSCVYVVATYIDTCMCLYVCVCFCFVFVCSCLCVCVYVCAKFNFVGAKVHRYTAKTLPRL